MVFLMFTGQSSLARIFLPGVLDYFRCDYKIFLKNNTNVTCTELADNAGIYLSLLKWKNKDLNCSKIPLTSKKGYICVDSWI